MFKIYNALRKHRRIILFICDFLLWNFSYYMAFAINKDNFSLTGEETVFLWGFLRVNGNRLNVSV